MAEQPEELNESQSAPQIVWDEQIEYLKGLAQVTVEHGLSELELQTGGVKFRLKAANAAQEATAVAVPAVAVTAKAPVSSKAKAVTEDLVPVVSPMVGLFFRQPSPGEPAFVEIGDRVEKGQTVGLVEAMKSFNEITAEAGGIVVEIPAENGKEVETGQTLILLKRG